MHTKPITISIIIPAYNESRRIPETLKALPAFAEQLKAHGLSLYEVLCVNDGSKDTTTQVVESIAKELIDIPIQLVTYPLNQGKGYAIRTGCLKAQGELILIADADMSTPWEEFFKLAEPVLSNQYQISIASRSVKSSQISTRQPWYRESMGKIFNLILRTLTGLPFKDTQCGFKLMKRQATQSVWPTLKVNRFAWDVEFLMISSLYQCKACEIGVVWNHKDESRVHPLKDSFEMLMSVLKIRVRMLLGHYFIRSEP